MAGWGSAGIIMVLAAVFVIRNNQTFTDYKKGTALYTNGTQVYDPNLIKTDTTKKRGSKENPFVILEVVPYRGYGELGYLVEGSEPVDLKALAEDDVNGETFRFLSHALEYKEDRYKISVKDIDSEEFAIEYENLFGEAPTGEEKEKWKQGAGYYYRAGYENTNILKKVILKAEGITKPTKEQLENYQVKVVTVTPEELNGSVAEDNDKKLDFTEIADMTYITSKTQNNAYIELYETYSKLGRAEPIKYGKKAQANEKLPDFYEHLTQEFPEKYASNDISWEAVRKLFTRIASGNRIPVIFDYHVYDINAGDKNSIKNVNKAYYQYTYSNKENYYEYSENGNINNASKLFLMCNVMDPGMFYTLYMEPDQETKTAKIQTKKVAIPNTNYEIETGVINGPILGKETEDTGLYWNKFTFLPVFSVGTSNKNEEGYSTEMEYWKALGYRDSGNWGYESAVGNVFVFNGREVFSNWNGKEPVFSNNRNNFDEVIAYIKNQGEREPLTLTHVLEYIIQSNKTIIYKKKIKILDLEPCTIQNESYYKKIGISSSDEIRNSYQYVNGITEGEIPERCIFTAKDIRNYLNNTYAGEVEIVRQSTGEFNGKIEELSDVYDLIYMGINDLMYNPASYNVSGETRYLPIYNDQRLNGKIYLHVGDEFDIKDEIKVDRNYGNKSVDWIKGYPNKHKIRGSGNDITKRKKEHLEAYIKGGYPILVEKDLYETGSFANEKIVDNSSNIYKFVDDNKSNSKLLSTGDRDLNEKIIKEVSLEKPQLLVDQTTPVRYNGTSTTGIIEDRYYLTKRELKFKYTIAPTHDDRLAKTYKAKIYVDTNSDGKFAEGECIYSGRKIQVEGEEYTITKKLSGEYVGAIPWKLELTNTQNANIKISEIGFSAIKRKESEKKSIKILQINQSNRKSSLGWSTLNIKTEEHFKKYLENLNDYKVDFYNITVEQFEKLQVLENDPQKKHQFNDVNAATRQETDALVKNYDMLIFGFADCYDTVGNKSGALDNTKYFINCGKSVLFTHDVTSYNNQDSNDIGYNFNVDFRNILAMDRFGVRNNGKGGDQATKPNGGNYGKEVTHGYTNLTVNILAAYGNDNNHAGNKWAPYFGDSLSKNPRTTERVTKLNEGQMTQYPYYIPDTIWVSSTHGQYYQLDMEDPGIVVWYCLAAQNKNTKSWYQNSYNDAANNYFIYSKGNVTYSGVGHSTVGKEEDEVKLFVNTMIASYRNAVEAPSAELLEETAVKVSDTEYRMYINNHYENKGEPYGEEEYQYILFSPVDNNFLSPELRVKVQLFDEMDKEKPGSEKLKVYLESEDPQNNKNAKAIDLARENLMNGERYFLKYPKSDLNALRRGKIVFTVTNEKEIEGGMMTQVVERSMFPLD